MANVEFSFTKIEGAQNDFVLVEDLEGRYSDEERRAFTVLACHRRRGIGADGSIFIEKSEGSEHFRMSFYNPDGSVGSMCGNGGRCAVSYAYHRGIAPSPMRFTVLNRAYTGEITESGVKLSFPPPQEMRLRLSLNVGGVAVPAHFIHTGAPHVVVFFDELPLPDTPGLDALNVNVWGADIRHLLEFQPDGANVNFLSIQDNIVHIRTFEKGVEAETESCGTGTIASALAAHLIRGMQPPITFLTHGGDTLRVGFDVNAAGAEGFPGLYFEGPVGIVFSGSITIDTDAVRIVHSLVQRT